jgi:RND family efflux transporter MFP subunit
MGCGIAQADQTAVPVQAAPLRAVLWRPSIDVAASVAAEQAASLAAERAGRVVAVLFTSGQPVPAGAVLVRLDDAPEAAQLAIDTAKLIETQNTLARAQKLISIAGASRAALEQAQADAAVAKAQVAYDQAVLAQLRIDAPFAGTLGIRNIAAGDYVQQGQVVATITQPGGLRVLFSVPQTEAGGIATGENFSFSSPSQSGPAATLPGVITALSPQLDTATNARDVEGQITGATGAVLPGMVGAVTLATGAAQPAYAVPATALNGSMLGPFVFVLDPAGQNYTLRTVYVTRLGDAGNNTVVRADGLQAGALVLTTGGFKLTDGASVTLLTH